MNDNPLDKKVIFLAIFFALLMLATTFLNSFLDGRTKIVFCAVGQGDAAYIRIKNNFDLLVDAGPDRSVLDCLGKYMPFYDRKIELVVLSHPQKDHYGGLSYLLDRYKIDQILMSPIGNPNKTFTGLKEKIKKKRALVSLVQAGLKVNLDTAQLLFLSPTGVASGKAPSDENDFSLVFLFQENNFRVLFTGDASTNVINRLSNQAIPKIDILKIPHHGSKNGLTKKFLLLADPTLSVISVGAKNSYGHPSNELLDMLKATKTDYKRTDKDGDIMFKL